MRTIAEELNIKLDTTTARKKSKWKRGKKDKFLIKIQERVDKEMENNTKLRTVREDKWERNEYIAACDGDLIKDIKLILHMSDLKKNYPKKEDRNAPYAMKWKTAEHVSKSRNSKYNKRNRRQYP